MPKLSKDHFYQTYESQIIILYFSYNLYKSHELIMTHWFFIIPKSDKQILK